MKIFILLAFSTLLLSSCLFHFVTDNYYDYLKPEQKERIKKLESFESTKPGFVYEITGKELREELKNQEKSMVYIFVNGCKGETCYPLSQIKGYAEENNLELFMVMNGYYHIEESMVQKVGLPLYSINSEAYDESKSKKYAELFRKDIGYYTYQETLDGNWPGRFLIFHKDQIVDTKIKLFDEEASIE